MYTGDLPVLSIDGPPYKLVVVCPYFGVYEVIKDLSTRLFREKEKGTEKKIL